MRLRADPIVVELRRLAPEISVNGGCFAHCLPHPATVPRTARPEYLERAKRDATEKCLIDLLATAGLPAVAPNRLISGERDWPDGYAGSVSHKGTTVVAALVPVERVRSLGIDIETREHAEDLSGIAGLTAMKELPPSLGTAGPVALFSAKEAAFKALYPVLGRRLGFEDITVSWTDGRSSCLRGTAHSDGVVLDVRCSTVIPSWVVSVALMRL